MSDDKRFFRSLLAASAQAGAYYIAEVSDPENTGSIIDTIEKSAEAAGLKTLQIDLRSFATFNDFLSTLQPHADAGVDVVSLVGGDEWLKGKCEALNIKREHMFGIGVRKIFWLQPETIAEIATKAPDTWAWRSGVYTLSGESTALPPKPPFAPAP